MPGTTSMGDEKKGLGLDKVFHAYLTVPWLSMDDVVQVFRKLDCFPTADIPTAVHLLTTISGSQAIPMKKLMFWIEIARDQDGAFEGKRLSLLCWGEVLRNLTHS